MNGNAQNPRQVETYRLVDRLRRKLGQGGIEPAEAREAA